MVDLTNPSDANWLAEGRKGIDVEAQVAALNAVKWSDVEQYRDARSGKTIDATTLRWHLADKKWRPAGETVDPNEPLPDPWYFIDNEGNRRALSPIDN